MAKTTKSKEEELMATMGVTKRSEKMSTGLLVFDIVTNGGIQKGKMYELASSSGLGKSTLVLSICANLCTQGYRVLYLDYEGAVSDSQLDGMGLREHLYTGEDRENHRFHLFTPSTYDQGDEIISALVPSKEFDLVVVDSVTAMVSDKYIDETGKNLKISDVRPGQDARLLSIFLKKCTADKKLYNTAFMFINQLRTNINMMGGPSKQESTGGLAMQFYPDARLKLTPIQGVYRNRTTINGTEKVLIGREVGLEAAKNKMGFGQIKVPLTVLFGVGISNIATYIQWMPNKTIMFEEKEIPMLKQGGAWYTITLPSGQYKVNGQDKLNNFVKEHYEEISSCFDESDFRIMQDDEIQKESMEFEKGNIETIANIEYEDPTEEVPENVDPETGEILDE